MRKPKSIVEKGSTEKKALLSQWFDHYCEISITCITWFNAEPKQGLSRRHALVEQGCKSAGGAFVVLCKRIANSFVLISSLTPEMDLARLFVSEEPERGALAFRPDSLAADSLNGDQLSARTDYTWDTDAFSGEFWQLTLKKIQSLMWTAVYYREELIHICFNIWLKCEDCI